jgi:hypothetical protein
VSEQLTDPIAIARQSYAEELYFTAHIRSPAVRAAFATVPRERFVGSGPWRVRSPMDMAEYWTTADADPRAVYHDVLIALDEARGINNGQPSLWAFLLAQPNILAGERVLHLGCGTGYYNAVMAELVGPTGKITAIEIDAGLAEKARAALMPWPQVVACGSTRPRFGARSALAAPRSSCERWDLLAARRRLVSLAPPARSPEVRNVMRLGKVKLLTDIEGASSRPVRKIVLRARP